MTNSVRLKASDKRIFGGETDVNQLLPFRYASAWDSYLAANRNHWLPGHMVYQSDLARAKFENLPPKTYIALELFLANRWAISNFVRELLLLVYRSTTAPEYRQYFLRMLQEESVALDAIAEVPMVNLQTEGIRGWISKQSETLANALTLEEEPDVLLYTTYIASILGLKRVALSALEGFLIHEAKLPPSLTKLVHYLERDSQLQSEVLTRLCQSLIDENPHVQPLFEACVTNYEPFCQHWDGHNVMTMLPARAIQYGNHKFSEMWRYWKKDIPHVPNPYGSKAKAIETKTQGSLEW